MKFILYHKETSQYIHARLFVINGDHRTKCGDLIFTPEVWAKVREIFTTNVEFIQDK